MTDRIINADMLGKLLDDWILEQNEPKDKFDLGYLACLYFIKNEINELSTHTPEPQESIFDADGWCWDFDKFKNYYSENGFLIKTDTGYTTIRCREQYRLCLRGVVAWRPQPPIPQKGK